MSINNPDNSNSPLTSTSIIFNDFEAFLSWLQLDIDTMTWHRKNLDQWEEFQSIFFQDGLKLSQIMWRFKKADFYTSTGPIKSWFKWLQISYINFIYIYYPLSLADLAEQSKLDLPYLITSIRNFLVDHYPTHEEEINSIFLIAGKLDKKIHYKFSDIASLFELSPPKKMLKSSLNSFEITLYEEWPLILEKFKQIQREDNTNDQKAHKKFYEFFYLLRDFFIIIILGLLGFILIYYTNLWYEEYLTLKINMYEPERVQKHVTQEIYREKVQYDPKKLQVKNIEELKDIDSTVVTAIENEVFETETDITLTSWDGRPKEFDSASSEKSTYEENDQKKGGYRDLLYGHDMVYRVMMRSSEATKTKVKLDTLLKEYRAKQVDQVQPGQEVPGGVYYNIFIPVVILKEFLTQVLDVDESVLFQNKTQSVSPPGMSKVMIWVKSV